MEANKYAGTQTEKNLQEAFAGGITGKQWEQRLRRYVRYVITHRAILKYMKKTIKKMRSFEEAND